MTVYTVGHSTHSIEEFIGLLQAHGIEVLADIRSYPGSRRLPWFGQEQLAPALERAGIHYVHIPALGGRRHGTVEHSGNEGWRVAAFRSYADYASTNAEFGSGLVALEDYARSSRVAYMCSEHTHLRCHRRIVSDYLKARGWEVLHIGSNGKLEPHSYTEHLRLAQGRVTYPKGGNNDE